MRRDRQAPHPRTRVKQAKQSRWRLSFAKVGICLLSLLCVGGWMYLHQPQTLPLRVVKFVGQTPHIKREQLKEVAKPWVRTGFFGISVNQLRQHLRKIAWLEEAEINRVWPDTIIITLHEQQAIALWNERSVLTTQGDLFTPKAETLPVHLTRFYGPKTQAKQMLARYRELQSELDNLSLKISELHLSERWSWSLTLNNGMTLLLGRDHPVVRMKRFVKAYPRVFAANKVQVAGVDLRYPSGMAVKFKH